MNAELSMRKYRRWVRAHQIAWSIFLVIGCLTYFTCPPIVGYFAYGDNQEAVANFLREEGLQPKEPIEDILILKGEGVVPYLTRALADGQVPPDLSDSICLAGDQFHDDNGMALLEAVYKSPSATNRNRLFALYELRDIKKKSQFGANVVIPAALEQEFQGMGNSDSRWEAVDSLLYSPVGRILGRLFPHIDLGESLIAGFLCVLAVVIADPIFMLAWKWRLNKRTKHLADPVIQ